MPLSEQHRAKLDGIVQQMTANKESDDTIQTVVNDFKQKYGAESGSPMGKPQDAFEKAVNYHTGNTLIDAPLGLLQGVAKGAASTGVGIGALYRKAAGLPALPENTFEADTKPEGIGQGTGKFLEQAAEFAAPAGAVSKGLKGAGFVARAIGQGATAGAVSAAQSGGDPTATITGAALGAGGEALGPALKAAKNLVKVSSNLDPAEQAAVNWAVAHGVPVDAATATGSKAIQNLQGLAKNTPGVAGYAKRQAVKQSAALESEGEKIAQSISPSGASTPESAGGKISAELAARREAAAKQAAGAYGKLESIENQNVQNVQVGTKEVNSGLVDPQGKPIIHQQPIMEKMAAPVDMKPVKAQLQPIYEELKQQIPVGQQQYSRGLQAIHNILEGKDFVPASAADQNLSAAKAIQRDATNLKTKWAAGKVIDSAGTAVNDAVSQLGPDAADALKQGRELTRAKYATQEAIDNLPTEPVQIFNKLTSTKDANINLLQDIAQKAPDSVPHVARAVVDGLMDKAFAEAGTAKPGTVLSEWNKLGDSTKKLLFKDPATIKNLDNFFTFAKKAAENPNPSGSGYVASLTADGGLAIAAPHLGIPYVISKIALGRLLVSPTGARILTQGLRIPARKGVMSSAAANSILRLAGKSARPVSQEFALQEAQ